MPGVIERVVENWLTSSTERSYQIPFCQLLAAEGETIIYVSPHGPFEQGKDVVTISAAGKPCGYQLKSGNLGLAEWRKYKGEINDLVELPITHPGIDSTRHHVPFLVTNGELKDPVIKAVVSANNAWRRRKYPALRTIAKGQLLKRFLAVHGSCLPHELSDFTIFMELILRDGREPLDKSKVARLLESVLPLGGKKRGGDEIRRSISSAVLLMGYVLERAYAVENHWAVFEGWIVAASYVLAAAAKTNVPTKQWSISFELCEIGALEALSGLFSECEKREHLIEGDLLTDGHVYHERIALLVGLVSAWSLYHRIKKDSVSRGEFLPDFLRKQVPQMRIWGESAIPYFATTALEMECAVGQSSAEAFLISVLRGVLDINGRRDGRPGMPSPYYSPEQALRLGHSLDQPCREDFVGAAYTVYPLIDFLVRRWRRQALWALWYPITGISLRAYYPGEKCEWFRWRAESGALESRFVGSPQSWAALLKEVETLDLSILPDQLRARPAFAVLFALVYPHRFTRELLKLIEVSLV